MSISAGAIFEVRTGGSDSNGGGFVTGASGTNYSHQDAAQYALTGLTTAAANAVILTASAAAVMVGNIIQITGGTNFTVGFYEILSVSVGVSITVDRTCTTAAGAAGTGNIGGGLASPGQASGAATISGNVIGLKSGTYTTTTGTSNVSGGVVVLASGVRLEGFGTTLGDLATAPVFKAHTGSLSLVSIPVSSGGEKHASAVNIEVDANGQSSITGFSGFGGSYSAGEMLLCVARGCATGFLGHLAVACSTFSCTTGFNAAGAQYCLASGGTSGFAGSTNSVIIGSVAYGCSSTGFDMSYNTAVNGCTAYNCGTGFVGSVGTTYPLTTFANNIAYGNSGYGFLIHASGFGVFLNNAAGNNTSGNFSTTPVRNVGFVSLSADPFTNAAGGDFSLNNTAGGGAALRAEGFPGVFLGGATTGYRDIGAVQHQDSGGGGGATPYVIGS